MAKTLRIEGSTEIFILKTGLKKFIEQWEEIEQWSAKYRAECGESENSTWRDDINSAKELLSRLAALEDKQ